MCHTCDYTRGKALIFDIKYTFRGRNHKCAGVTEFSFQYSHCWGCLSVVTRYKTLCHTLHVTRRRVTLCHVTRVIVTRPGPGEGTRQPHTAPCHVMWGVWRVTVWQCDSWQPGDITTGRRGWRWWWVGQPLTEPGNNKHSSDTHIHTRMSQ